MRFVKRGSSTSSSGRGGRHVRPRFLAPRGLIGRTGIAALLLFGGLVGFLLLPAFAATTWTVCSSGCNFTTIQAAIDAASDGDTITVSAGAYTESISIGKAIILRGAKAGVPAGPSSAPDGRDVSSPYDSLTESVISGEIRIAGGVGDVVIDGFIINSADDGVYLNSHTVGATIENNVITGRGMSDPPASGGSAAIKKLGSDNAATYIIQGNRLEGGAYGIQLNSQSAIDTVHVLDNYLNIVYTGIQTYQNVSVANRGVGVLTVSGNIFNKNFTAMRFAQGGHTVTGNTVKNLIAGGRALKADLSNSIGGVTYNLGGLTITGNSFSGGQYGVWLASARASTAYTVTGNSLTGVAGSPNYELFIDGPQAGTTVNATNNYWGSPNGPGASLSAGIATVTSSPLIASYATPGAEPGFDPTGVVSGSACSTVCYVAPTGSDTNLGTVASPFLTVQKGINAVSGGGTVNIAAGTYAEALTVGKSVTLSGPNAAISPNSAALSGGLPMENSSRVAEAVIAPLKGGTGVTFTTGVSGLTVVLQGLTFDLDADDTTGTLKEGVSRYMAGTNNLGLSLTATNNRFINNPGANNGAWYLTGDNGNISLTLTGNRFAGEKYSTNGIASWNGGSGRKTVLNISRNVWVDNKGWAFNISSSGDTSGRVVDNWIGNTAAGDGVNHWTERQSGFLLSKTYNGLLISGNTFRNIEYSAVNFWNDFSGTVSIEHNLFDGYSNMGDAYLLGSYSHEMLIGPRPDTTYGTPALNGVTVAVNSFVDGFTGSLTIANRTGGGTIDARSNWWGCSTGPNTTGCAYNTEGATTSPFIGGFSLGAVPRTPGFWPSSMDLKVAAIVAPTVIPLAGNSLGSPTIEIASAPAGATVTVTVPTVEALPEATSTPFKLDDVRLIEIAVDEGVLGPFTVCLDGDQTTDRLWHYEGSAWVDITWRIVPTPVPLAGLDPTDYPGRVCGMTADLSPFAASSSKPTLTVTPNNQRVTAGDPAPTYTFDVTGFVDDETEETAADYTAPICTSTYAPASPAGTRPITCSGGSAADYLFDVSATSTLTIDPRPVTDAGGGGGGGGGGSTGPSGSLQAKGDGSYRVGTARAQFLFSVRTNVLSSGSIEYRGNLSWMVLGRWRLSGAIGNISNHPAYRTVPCPPSSGAKSCTTFSGTGVLQRWDGDSWASSNRGAVMFTVTIYDGRASSKDRFGIQIHRMSSSALPESAPTFLSKGWVRLV